MSATVFTNGTIWTGVESNLIVGALAIEGESIVALGAQATELISSGGDVIDLQGGMLLPAFGDGHAHPLFGGLESIGPQIKGAPSMDVLLETVKAFA